MEKNKNAINLNGKIIDITTINFLSPKDRLLVLAKKGNAIQYILDPLDEEQKTAVKQNGYSIRYISNPSYELQKIAISSQATSVQFINNPHQDLLMQAFEKDPNVLQFIKNPTYEIQLDAVKRKGGTIMYIKNPHFNIISEALKENPMSIQYIKMPSHEMIEKIISQKPKAVKNIINKLPYELQINAVGKKGQLIKYIKNPSYDLQKAAVDQDPLCIKYIDKPTIELQESAVRKSSSAFQYVDRENNAIQKIVIKNKPNLIHEIINPSKDIIELYEKTILKVDPIERKKVAKGYIKPAEAIFLREKYRSLFDKLISDPAHGYCLIENKDPLYEIINILCDKIEVKNANIATGYLYKSGLNMINNSIRRLINTKGKLNLIIGSLQKYLVAQNAVDYIMSDMDIPTVRYLNGLKGLGVINIRTLTEAFYHGKFYYFEGKEQSFVIIGSSNVSSSGLLKSREVNMIYVFKNGSPHSMYYKEWFNQFWDECYEIEQLDENLFASATSEKDKETNSENTARKVNIKMIEERVKSLSDEVIKRRFEMWLKKEPDNIYENANVHCLKGYTLFEYKRQDLLVFESFEPNNAFYCFKGCSVNDLIKKTQGLSKIQLYKISYFYRKGYHINDLLNLEININSLFVNEII